jgi:tungstate transport system ATP-binding protein
MNAEPIYRLEGVSVSYEGRQVLAIDSLSIQQGEILAVIGPSGAGKSTLLRLLNFLEPPTEGTIYFHGSAFNSKSEMTLEQRRKVTTVFQRPLLLSRSVRDNVEYGLMLRGIREFNGAVQAALDSVSLGNMGRQKARTLSGGEAQRVSLARAIVVKPEVLLLDEPTANLDPHNVGLIENIVADLKQEQNTTLVLVTHNVFQAHRLAHRVVFLMDGKIIEMGEVGTIFESPTDARTAAFVRGEMVY